MVKKILIIIMVFVMTLLTACFNGNYNDDAIDESENLLINVEPFEISDDLGYEVDKIYSNHELVGEWGFVGYYWDGNFVSTPWGGENIVFYADGTGREGNGEAKTWTEVYPEFIVITTESGNEIEFEYQIINERIYWNSETDFIVFVFERVR